MKLICVGKLKEKYLQEAVVEYQKRICRYTKLELIEIEDVSLKDTKKVLEIEGQKILNHIKEKDYVITLEIEGEMMDSIAFSKNHEAKEMQGPITFVIGGSEGLSPMVKKRSNQALSFSKMTFPHPLFRVLLLEQIYRSYKIRKNETYHK